jgi:hypothetical protein
MSSGAGAMNLLNGIGGGGGGVTETKEQIYIYISEKDK